MEKVGGIDTTLKYVFDFELWLRMISLGSFEAVPDVLATTRWYPGTITLSNRPETIDELIYVIERMLTESENLRPDQKAKVLTKVYFLGSEIYLKDSRCLTKAIRSWILAFTHGQRKLLFLLSINKAKRHIKRILNTHGETQPRLHWTHWKK